MNIMGEKTGEAGKYLIFRLGAEEYGFTILKVREIIKLPDITRVPRTPEYVQGVMNLRGKVIPVISLRNKFGMDQVETTRTTCVIITDVAGENGPVSLGVIVDEVSEVLEILDDAIEEPPALGADVDTTFILGMGKDIGGIKILIDMDKALTSSDVRAVQSIGNA